MSALNIPSPFPDIYSSDRYICIQVKPSFNKTKSKILKEYILMIYLKVS